MADKRFNLVSFQCANDGPRIFLKLEGAFILSAGVGPNVNRALIPYTEFDKLAIKDGIADLGKIEFWYSSDPAEGGEPDHSIDGIRIVDVEPNGIGIPKGSATARIVEYRLILEDLRERFVGWRGGIVDGGEINKQTGRNDKRVENDTLIARCLDAMGAIYEFDNSVESLRASPPLGDLNWAASSAPDELTKLLDYCRATIVVNSVGSLNVVMMGDGEGPEIPADREVPGLLKMPGRGRRGKTIIFTSAPYPIIETFTLKGPDAATWQFVARDKGESADSQVWTPLSDNVLYMGKGAVQMVRDNFKDADATVRDRLRGDTYHYLRLNKNKKDPAIAKVLRLLKLTKDEWDLPQVSAKIAVQQGDGTWKNSDKLVSVHVTDLLQDHRSDEPILQVAELMGRAEPDGAASLETSFKALINGEIEVRVSAYAGKVGKQEFFSIGFTKGTDGVQKIDDKQLAALIEKADKDATFISAKELQLYRVDGEDVNRKELEDSAKKMAELFLKGSEEPYEARVAVGFLAGECSGKVTEIAWDQAACTTTFKINAWGYPLYIAGVRERLKGLAAFAAQNQTAASRLALGGVGASQPSVPIIPAPRPPPASGGSLPSGPEQFTQWTNIVPWLAAFDFDRATP